VLRGNLTQTISAAAVQPQGTAFVFDGKQTQVVSFERPGTGNRSYLREVTINSAASVRVITDVFVTGQINNYGKFEVIDTRSLFLGNAAGINHQGGTLVGNGTVNTPTKSFTNDGNIRPGASPGIMRIAGSYLQRPAGKLTIEIGGLTVATQYSRLEVSSSATLDGALELDLTNSYKASVGDSFRVMSFGSAIGRFAQVISAPPKNVEFHARYKATGVDLIAVPSANRAPVAQNDSAATRMNKPLTLNVLHNDVDANDDPLQVTALELANTIGKVEIAGDSSLTYSVRIFNASVYTTIGNIKATELRFEGRGFLRGATAYQWLVRVSDAEFTIASADTFSFSTVIVSSVEAQQDQLPTAFALEQNYPNPFNPSTAISFALPKAGWVNLSIFNSNGQLVKQLVSGEMAAGRHTMIWTCAKSF